MSDITVAAAGAGRMGQGLAVVFAYAGHRVQLIDLKRRDNPEDYLAAARADIQATFDMLVACGMMDAADVERVTARIDYVDAAGAAEALSRSDLVFEAEPETVEAKTTTLAFLSSACRPDVTIASTTSTFLSDSLQAMVRTLWEQPWPVK